mmetsp:Transcript_7742/g.19973  ORF Transcript_7742/g.19973 Transcript_7742/m.19973 type:complete len:226 (-) Transcript_7742:1079-1756(-)
MRLVRTGKWTDVLVINRQGGGTLQQKVCGNLSSCPCKSRVVGRRRCAIILGVKQGARRQLSHVARVQVIKQAVGAHHHGIATLQPNVRRRAVRHQVRLWIVRFVTKLVGAVERVARCRAVVHNPAPPNDDEATVSHIQRGEASVARRLWNGHLRIFLRRLPAALPRILVAKRHACQACRRRSWQFRDKVRKRKCRQRRSSRSFRISRHRLGHAVRRGSCLRFCRK